MDVKKAIRFISKHIADFKERTEGADDKEGCEKLIMEAKGVITLLQQGEAYRQMWEELEHALTDSEDYNVYSWSPKAREIMKDIEIKHFPKEVDHEYPESEE